MRSENFTVQIANQLLELNLVDAMRFSTRVDVDLNQVVGGHGGL